MLPLKSVQPLKQSIRASADQAASVEMTVSVRGVQLAVTALRVRLFFIFCVDFSS